MGLFGQKREEDGLDRVLRVLYDRVSQAATTTSDFASDRNKAAQLLANRHTYRAIRHINKAKKIAEKTNTTSNTEYIDVLIAESLARIQAGEHRKAQEAAAKAVDLQPNNLLALITQGAVYRQGSDSSRKNKNKLDWALGRIGLGERGKVVPRYTSAITALEKVAGILESTAPAAGVTVEEKNSLARALYLNLGAVLKSAITNKVKPENTENLMKTVQAYHKAYLAEPYVADAESLVIHKSLSQYCSKLFNAMRNSASDQQENTNTQALDAYRLAQNQIGKTGLQAHLIRSQKLMLAYEKDNRFIVPILNLAEHHRDLHRIFKKIYHQREKSTVA